MLVLVRLTPNVTMTTFRPGSTSNTQQSSSLSTVTIAPSSLELARHALFRRFAYLRPATGQLPLGALVLQKDDVLFSINTPLIETGKLPVIMILCCGKR
jgi:hypothetical protein